MPGTNYFKIGVFTFAGLAVTLAGFFFIGLSGSLFKESISCVTFFDRSVQGLNVDSNVKFRGFNVGKVTGITLAAVDDKSDRQPLVKVTFDIDPKALSGSEDKPEQSRDYIKRQADLGLKAFLSYQGITGLGYLDLDYNSDVKSDVNFELAAKMGSDDRIFIPNGPGQIMEISESATAIVKSLSDVDFAGISQDIKQLVKTVDSAVDNLNTAWLSADLSDTIQEVGDAAAQVAELARNLDETIKGGSSTNLGREMEASVKQFRATLKRLDQLMGSSQGNLPVTLDNLRAMSENLREMSELLKDQPSQAFFGQPPKAVRPGGGSANKR